MKVEVQEVKKTNIASKRLMAWGLDWVLGGILSSIPAVVAYSLVTKRGTLFTSLYDFKAMGSSTTFVTLIGLICLVIGILYYMIVPWKIYPGQTLGKKIVHIKIEKVNGQKMTFSDYFIRQVIFLFFIEGSVTILSRYIVQLMTLSSNFYIDSYLAIFWFALTTFSAMLALGTASNLSIHDRVMKTVITVSQS